MQGLPRSPLPPPAHTRGHGAPRRKAPGRPQGAPPGRPATTPAANPRKPASEPQGGAAGHPDVPGSPAAGRTRGDPAGDPAGEPRGDRVGWGEKSRGHQGRGPEHQGPRPAPPVAPAVLLRSPARPALAFLEASKLNKTNRLAIAVPSPYANAAPGVALRVCPRGLGGGLGGLRKLGHAVWAVGNPTQKRSGLPLAGRPPWLGGIGGEEVLKSSLPSLSKPSGYTRRFTCWFTHQEVG